MSIELSSIPSVLPAALIRPVSIESSRSFRVEGTDTPPDGFNNATISETLAHHDMEISRVRAAVIIGTVASMTFLNSLLTGILTVALPRIAKDLKLADSLILW
jgi:hypothetical protein